MIDPGEGEVLDYLLGGLDEARAEEIEMRLLTDPAYFDYVEEAEDQLIDSYVRGQMDVKLRARFEAAYGTSGPRKARVETASAMHRAALSLSAPRRARKKIWSSGKRRTFTLVFASLAVATLAVFLTRLQRAPAPPQNRITPKTERTVSLLVRPGRVRGEKRAAAALQIPADATDVQIEMALPAGESGREFRAILDSAARPAIATAPAMAKPNGTAVARFAARLFAADDYVVRLVEPGAENKERRVATYFFRAVK